MEKGKRGPRAPAPQEEQERRRILLPHPHLHLPRPETVAPTKSLPMVQVAIARPAHPVPKCRDRLSNSPAAV